MYQGIDPMEKEEDKDRLNQVPIRVTEIILESISDGVFTVDHEWRITSFNRAAETITGVPRQKALGKHCWEVFRSNMCETDCALRRTMKKGKPFVQAQPTAKVSQNLVNLCCVLSGVKPPATGFMGRLRAKS